MGDFFRGWRRKVGVVTLMTACVIMAVWIRSQFKVDEVWIPMGSAAYGFASAGGAIDFFRVWEPGPPMQMIWSSYDCSADRGGWLDETGYISPWSVGHQIEWGLIGCGFRVGMSRIADRQDADCVLPYWSVVIPLTLLSAFLLLTKSRNLNPKKTVEPTAANGI